MRVNIPKGLTVHVQIVLSSHWRIQGARDPPIFFSITCNFGEKIIGWRLLPPE